MCCSCHIKWKGTWQSTCNYSTFACWGPWITCQSLREVPGSVNHWDWGAWICQSQIEGCLDLSIREMGVPGSVNHRLGCLDLSINEKGCLDLSIRDMGVPGSVNQRYGVPGSVNHREWVPGYVYNVSQRGGCLDLSIIVMDQLKNISVTQTFL